MRSDDEHRGPDDVGASGADRPGHAHGHDQADHDHAGHSHAAALAPDDPRLLRVQERLDEARAAVRLSGLPAPRPTGTVSPGATPGRVHLVVSRRLPVPQSVAWYNVATSEGLARWFGPYDGDPRSGRVDVTMLAEEGHPTLPIDVVECRAPDRLVVRSVGEGAWDLAIDFQPDVESCFATLTHLDVEPGMVGDVGPGWEFYMDRLLAAEGGGDPSAVDFAEYHPSMSEHFTAQL
ncbi:MAG: hypothetical protein ACTHXO_09430 [Actinomycetaceae bacterium]